MEKYDREWFVEWASSFLAGTVVVVLIAVLGGPSWASAGFGLMTFYLFRATDKLRSH